MATTSKFDFGLINDQIKEHTDQIANKANAIARANQTAYGTDLNNYTETGMYGIQGATNYPTGNIDNQYGTLIVTRYTNTDYITQIWQTVLSTRAWIRIKNGGTWSAWSAIALGPVNNLASDSTTEALSAAMGKSLNDSKVPYLNIGVVSGQGTAWDAIPVYDRTVVGEFFKDGQWSFVAYKYSGSQYGTMLSMKFNGVLHFLSVSNGNKTERTI